MEEKRDNARQYDVLLDKVIKVTEDNLKAQSDYLHELTLIRGRFEINDRDHNEVKQQLNSVASNTFSILNKMNNASNEVIISMLEKSEDYHTAFSYKTSVTNEQIKLITDKLSLIDNIIEDNKYIKKTVESTEKSFTLIQKLLGVLLIVVMGVQIVAFAWNSVKNENLNDNIKSLLNTEMSKRK